MNCIIDKIDSLEGDESSLLPIANRLEWWETKSKLKTFSFHSPSSTYFTKMVQENREWWLLSVHETAGLLLLHGLPKLQHDIPSMGCHPSQTDPAWASHRLQPSKHCSSKASYHRVHPSASAPAQSPHGLWLWTRAASAGALHRLQFLQDTSTVALWAPPWLHAKICSVWCPWAVAGQPASPWASPELQRASAAHLEHLQPFSCTDLGACWSISLSFSHSSLPAAQYFIFSFLKSGLTECNQGHCLSFFQKQIPFWAIWSWLLSSMGQYLVCSHKDHTSSTLIYCHVRPTNIFITEIPQSLFQHESKAESEANSNSKNWEWATRRHSLHITHWRMNG